MQITISTKKLDALKKIFNETTMTSTIQKVVDDWADFQIQTKYKSKKTTDEMADEISAV